MARTTYKPPSLAKTLLAECPRSNKQQLTKKNYKGSNQQRHATKQRLDHTKSLLRQGQTFKSDLEAASWADVVTTLPDSTMKFALNAAQDTLPHNQNLHMWGKISPQTPVLCVDSDKLMSTH